MKGVVIVAAGRGTRMGPGIDKLFLEIAGRPVVAHTWLRFDAAPCVDTIVLVVRAGMESAFTEMATQLPLTKPWRLAAGGKERQDSVWAGLQALPPECDLVAIQDGARPCTDPAVIAATLDAAVQVGAAVTAQRVTDTVKEAGEGEMIARHLDRSRLWAVQTPQAFRREVILHALGQVRDQGLLVTDDTAACELIGQPVKLVESPLPNPKITTPSDIEYLESQLRRR